MIEDSYDIYVHRHIDRWSMTNEIHRYRDTELDRLEGQVSFFYLYASECYFIYKI